MRAASIFGRKPLSTGTRASATPEEALFLRCILQSQYDFGMKPPAELAIDRDRRRL
jgi:hypothetical protein